MEGICSGHKLLFDISGWGDRRYPLKEYIQTQGSKIYVKANKSNKAIKYIQTLSK